MHKLDACPGNNFFKGVANLAHLVYGQSYIADWQLEALLQEPGFDPW